MDINISNHSLIRQAMTIMCDFCIEKWVYPRPTKYEWMVTIHKYNITTTLVNTLQ